MEHMSAEQLLHEARKTHEEKRHEPSLLEKAQATLERATEGSTKAKEEASKRDLTIVDIIRREHDEVDRLYSQYLAATAGEIKEAKGFLILRQLVMHCGKEEVVLYPAVRAKLENGNAIADRSEEEHQQITLDLYELDKLSWPQNPAEFDRLVRVAMEKMHKHVLEEESVILPKLIAACTTKELCDLGHSFMSQMVTTRPHPSAPREGVAAQLAQAAMLPVDAIRDAVRFDDKTKAAAMAEPK